MPVVLSSVAFSPDDKSIVYVEGRRRMVKRSLDGGSPVVLTDVDDFGGVDWISPDEIVFGSGADQGLKGLFRLKTAGGTPVEFTFIDKARKELSHQNPRVLEGGHAALFTIWLGSAEQAEIGAVSLADGRVVPLGIRATRPLGVVDGHLVYLTVEGALMAIPFDAQTLRTSGTAVLVRDLSDSAPNTEPFLSHTGGLVYARAAAKRRIVWVDRNGHATPAFPEARGFDLVRISPDGRRAAITIQDAWKRDLWILDFDGGTLTPLTSTGTIRNPAWSSDSRRVLYPSTQDGPAALWWHPVDGSGPAVKAVVPPHNPWFIDLTPDGRHVAYAAVYKGSFNVEALALDDSKSAIEIVASASNDGFPRFSPDGKAVAYTSEDAGGADVYVQTFPEPGRVRVARGRRPIWDRDGKRLYYRDAGRVMVATIARDPALRVVSRETLFETRIGGTDYDLGRDGRFLMIETETSNASLVVIPNWRTELRRQIAK
jgi:WD40 repeat protein